MKPKNTPQSTNKDILTEWGFEPFPVGKITTPLPRSAFNKKTGKRYNRVRITVPGRLQCLIKDPVNLIKREPTGEFNYGEIAFGVDLMSYAEVVALPKRERVIVSEEAKRPGLVKHFAEIMVGSIDYQNGIRIEAKNDFPYSHVGSGSSAALATATALAINKLAGEPVRTKSLPLFLAQNYGEEIEGSPNLLTPVQCTGGTSLMALHGGLIVVEDSKLVERMEIPENLVYVIGIPEFPKPDSQGAMAREAKAVFQHILDEAKYMQPFFAQNFKEMRQAISNQDMYAVGKVIETIDSDEVIMKGYDNMFSGINVQYKKLLSLLEQYNTVATFISSAGPSFVTICPDFGQEKVMDQYKKIGISDVIVAEPVNQGFVYEMLEN